MKKLTNNQKGFSLFMAITIAAALLLVTFIVSSISTKSLEFASLGRDSQIAFFAADAGVECALYWDVNFDPSKFDFVGSGSPIMCGGGPISNGDAIAGTSTNTRIGGGGMGNPTSTFGFVMNRGINPTTACAIVIVTKGISSTHISSFGYNTCNTNDSRRVERGIEVDY